MRRYLLFPVLVLLLITGCVSLPISGSGQPAARSGTAPAISSFTANPYKLDQGHSSRLSWRVTGATSVTIDQGIGNVDAVGSTVVNPGSTVSYVLTASNAYGSKTAVITVSVLGGSADTYKPLIYNFWASPSMIDRGGTVTLNWSVFGADRVSIDRGVGNVPVNGSVKVKPSSSTTYKLTAYNKAGSVTVSTDVEVVSPSVSLPEIQWFVANPETILPGSKSTLSWYIKDATRVNITGRGSVPSSGSVTVSPANTTVYILEASNASGKSQWNVVVNVVSMDPVIYYDTYHVSPDYMPPALYDTETIGGGGYSGAGGSETSGPGGGGYSGAYGNETSEPGGGGYSDTGSNEVYIDTFSGSSGQEQYENIGTQGGGGFQGAE